MPGSSLDEIALAGRFHISRSPVREALIRLAAGGFIIQEKNRVSIVRPFDMAHLPKYIEALSLMQRMTSRLAAYNATREDIKTIEGFCHAHLKAYNDGDIMAMITLNRQFHGSIGAASKNPYFHGLYARLLEDNYRLLRFHFHTFNDELPEEYIQDHMDLLESIKHKDGEKADLIAKNHVIKVWKQFTEFLMKNPNFEINLSTD